MRSNLTEERNEHRTLFLTPFFQNIVSANNNWVCVSFQLCHITNHFFPLKFSYISVQRMKRTKKYGTFSFNFKVLFQIDRKSFLVMLRWWGMLCVETTTALIVHANTGGAEFLYRSSLKLNFTEERKEIKTKCLEMQFATIADDNGEI